MSSLENSTPSLLSTSIDSSNCPTSPCSSYSKSQLSSYAPDPPAYDEYQKSTDASPKPQLLQSKQRVYSRIASCNDGTPGSTPTKTLDKDLNSERKAFEELKIRRNRQTQQNLKMEATWSSISSSTVQCFIDRDDISPIVVSLIIARPLLQMQIENLLENMAKDKMNECNLQKRSHHHLQTTKA